MTLLSQCVILRGEGGNTIDTTSETEADLEALHLRVLDRLQHWYDSGIKAQNLEGRTGGGSLGHVVLWSGSDRGLREYLNHRIWLYRHAPNRKRREDLVAEVLLELRRVSGDGEAVRAARSQTWFRQEFRADREHVARAEGSSREVAGLYGVSQSSVVRWRKEFGTSASNGTAPPS